MTGTYINSAGQLMDVVGVIEADDNDPIGPVGVFSDPQSDLAVEIVVTDIYTDAAGHVQPSVPVQFHNAATFRDSAGNMRDAVRVRVVNEPST